MSLLITENNKVSFCDPIQYIDEPFSYQCENYEEVITRAPKSKFQAKYDDESIYEGWLRSYETPSYSQYYPLYNTEICYISYSDLKHCGECTWCPIKPKISVPNDTDFINYATASKSEKEETTSESIKMVVGMNGDNVNLLQGGIQNVIVRFDVRKKLSHRRAILNQI